MLPDRSEGPDRSDTSIVCSPTFNTEISGVSFSVFCIEDDWRQVQVPSSITLLASIWILAFAQQLSFLMRHVKKDTPPQESGTSLARSLLSLEVCHKRQARKENGSLAIHPLVLTKLPLDDSVPFVQLRERCSQCHVSPDATTVE